MPNVRLLTLLLALCTALPAFAGDKPDVVYHLADTDKVSFALGNVRNHIKGVGGGDNVNIVLVMHGPAVRSFVDIEAVDKVRNKVKALQDDGVKFEVCANTMNAIGVTLDEMLPGMISADNGGVVRMAELQSHGYLYIRP